ncbi:unknown [[Clostridium] leptum CAG:27]|uniref:Uncharacterized protein n=1 Tax=[Clostridium] leptum CAG:27 TaxID=1263068 RepID=R6MX04_9FIRM|nr:unknown [[Clostridium] leptum CAG:27]
MQVITHLTKAGRNFWARRRNSILYLTFFLGNNHIISSNHTTTVGGDISERAKPYVFHLSLHAGINGYYSISILFINIFRSNTLVIEHINWVIDTVRKHIGSKYPNAIINNFIRIQKPSNCRIVIAGL